jgi:hypothetical protein
MPELFAMRTRVPRTSPRHDHVNCGTGTTEPLIGEQAQVDWAHVGHIKVAGGERALWAFVMVLAWSRAMWAELVLDLTVHSVRRSIARAIQAFGGSTRQWLFDNPKTIVLERHDNAVRFPSCDPGYRRSLSRAAPCLRCAQAPAEGACRAGNSFPPRPILRRAVNRFS